jgi:membrane fusion protein (multidrug efflux system)
MKRIIENKKILIAIVAAVLLIGAIAYMLYRERYRSTENAYLNADVVVIASQVPGKVVGVHVTNNQHVHKGDPLFDVDPEPFRIALARARADLAQAMQSAREDNAEIAAMRAQVDQTGIDLKNAQTNYTRAKELVAQHFMSQQAADDALTRVQALQASLEQARAKLDKARSVPRNPGKRADVLKAEAEIAQAKLNLENAHVTAPEDGMISNLSLTAGSLVSVGVPLFALISENSFHIDANFKETELPGIHPGQAVDIDIDMYPDHTFHGVVDSLSGGTGTAFSLLPPQNATGNWVKIAQRVPVRIKFDPAPGPDYPLRIGATATVTVHLK